jgi:hypothetical protein
MQMQLQRPSLRHGGPGPRPRLLRQRRWLRREPTPPVGLFRGFQSGEELSWPGQRGRILRRERND